MNKKFHLLMASLILLTNFFGFLPQQAQAASPPGFTIATLSPSWTTGIISDFLVPAGILVTDLDKDGKTEVLTCSNGYAYALHHMPGDQFETTWYSEYLNCEKIVAAARDTSGIQTVFIATRDGKVVLFNGSNYQRIGEFALPQDILVTDMDVADVDGDGVIEIVLVCSIATLVYDANTFAQEWYAAGYGGMEVAAANIEGDAALEIIVNDSTAHILNAKTKTTKWGYSGGFGSRMAVGDVDGDNLAEIAYFSNWGTAAVFDADTRTIKWQRSDLGDMGAISVADVDGIGSREVIIGNSQWGNVIGLDGRVGTVLWSIANPEHGVSGIGVGDANNDGTHEILWGAGLYSSGKDVLIAGSWKSQRTLWISEDLDGPLFVAAADLEMDGQGEIIMASASSNSNYDSGILKIYDGATHQLKWSTTILNFAYPILHLGVGQLDSDPPLEILVGSNSYEGRVQIYDGLSRAIEWTSPYLKNGLPKVIEMRNLDADIVDEIVIGFSSGRVLVLNGASSVIQWDSGILDGPVEDLSLGDLTGDGVLDLAVLTINSVYIYRVDTWARESYQPLGSGRELAIVSATPEKSGELVIASCGDNLDCSLRAWSGTNFQETWSRYLGNVYVTDLLAADVEADGVEEITVMGRTVEPNSHRSFFAIAYTSYPFFWEYQASGYWGNINSTAVFDVDNDGENELVFGSDSLFQVNEIVTSTKQVYSTYLPVASRTIAGFYGRVTENGVPAANVPLSLRFYDGSSWSTAATAVTSSDGLYIFTGIPSLGPGQYYYVLYQNGPYGDPGRLWTWHTRSLSSYQSGSQYHSGDFDIANIQLWYPFHYADVSLPTTFQWRTRPASPTDIYEFNLYNPYNPDTYFFTDPPLGYVSTYRLSGLPPGFQINKLYYWDIWVYSPDGGYGISYDSYVVTFTGVNTSSGLQPGPSTVPRKMLTDLELRP